MEFEFFLNERIPDYESVLTIEEIKQVKELYDEYILWMATEKAHLLNGFHLITDGSLALEKAAKKRMCAKNCMEKAIQQLQEQHDLDVPKKKIFH